MNSIIAALYGDPNAPGSTTLPTPGQFDPGYVGSFGWYRDEAQRAAAQAEFDAAGSTEERSNQLITDMYYGGTAEEDRRVLTQAELENGWVDALGRYRQGIPAETRSEEELAAIRYRNLSHDWYNAGMEHFEQPFELTNEWDISDNVNVYGNPEWMNAANAYLRANNGGNATISPWINTFQQDRIGTYNLIKDADYNAFLGSQGRRQSNVDGYRDDSIAGWFKNAFAGKDQISNRNDAIRSLRIWNENEGGGGVGLNKATDVMTKQYFDQLDLANKYGLTWEQAGAVANQNYSESSSPPVNPGNGAVLPGNGTALPGNGMLSRQNSNWMDVLNRGGAQNWDSLLGQYTYNSPLDWASMDNQTVQTEFSDLFDTGGMFTKGKNRDLIYAKLMENMGRV